VVYAFGGWQVLGCRVALGLTAMLALGTMGGCDKQADKQAVEDMVNARIDAEKAKTMADDYAKLKEENTALKAQVADLQKQLEAKNAQVGRLAQAAKTEKAEAVQTQHDKAVKTLKKQVTGANGGM